MKRKIMRTLCLLLLLSASSLYGAASQTALSRSILTQHLTGVSHEQRLLSVDASLNRYLATQYNQNDYAELLSHNINHLIILLGTLKKLSLDQDGAVYAYTMLKLFTDKMKACELVTHGLVEQILRFLPSLIGYYFEAEESGYSLRALKTFSRTLLEGKLAQYGPAHYDSPDQQAEKLSPILALAEYKRQQETLDSKQAIWRLRLVTIRFIDTLLSKIVWSQTNYHGNWPSFCTIAHLIERLGAKNILDHRDDIDSLHWSLVHRFRYFITLTGSIFPIDFYNNIEHDLQTHSLPFMHEEMDAVTTKSETLLQTVMLGKTKAAAFKEAGIIDAVY